MLATSVERDLLSAFPAQLTGPTDADTAALRESVAARLVAILGLAPTDADALRAKLAAGNAYVVLAHDLTPAQSDAINAGLADGSLVQVRLEPEPVRVYPLAGGATGTTLAAQLLGFVNRDGTGQYGIEGRWQDLLAGSPQVLLAERDGSGRPIMENAQTVEPGSPGTSLTLTIDASLQLKLEQEVYAAWVADRAKSVSGVVMDPKTGEILASATYPSYDGNDYAAIAASDPSRFIDPVVSSVYEPGLGLQAADRDSGPGERGRHAHDEAPGPVGPQSRRRAGVRPERRSGKQGHHHVPGRDRLVPQRRHVEGRPHARPDHAPGGRRPLRRRGPAWASAPRPASTWPARWPASSATRRSRRGSRSTSRTARSARASRSP